MGQLINCIMLEGPGLKAPSEKVEMFIKRVDKILMKNIIKNDTFSFKYPREEHFKLKRKQNIESGNMKG